MATQADLFLAILALDAYNRGYNPGMTFTGNSASPGTQIGDATIQDSSANTSSSFYAVAYSWDGETVISYRGTTFPGKPDIGDVLNGWTLSLGFAAASQAQEALSFYTEVQSQIAGATDSQVIQLTGHSLGGGLAGFVSDLTGAPADVFNNIPFGTGVVSEIVSQDLAQGMTFPGSVISGYDIFTGQYYEKLPSSSATVRQFVTEGEVAGTLRALSGYLSYNTYIYQGLDKGTAQALINYGVALDNSVGYSQTLSSNAGSASATDLHSQSLMVLLLYANVNGYTEWASIGAQLYDALYNNSLAEAAGFVTAKGTWYGASAKMMAGIAYSALDSGYMPFGNTGIQSLFNDIDTLGEMQTDGQFTGLLSPTAINPYSSPIAAPITPVGALTEIAVQFAADQALAANQAATVLSAPGNTNQNLAQGAFAFGGSTLKVDLNPADWTSTFPQGFQPSTTTTAVVGLGDFFHAVLANVSAKLVQSDPTYSWITSNATGFSAPLLQRLNEITQLDIAIGGGALSAAGTLPAAYDKKNGGAMLIGQLGQGSITGSANGNDIIVGGSTVTTGNGNDIIFAGGGPENITVGTGKNQILADTAGMNVTLSYSGATGAPSTGSGAAGASGAGPAPSTSPGNDLVIGNGAGGDAFTFNAADQAAFTVVWGGTGNDTFDINTTNSAEANVLLLNMSGVTASNITSLDMSKLQSYVDGLGGNNSAGYGGDVGTVGPTIVILNPTASDTFEYDGTVLSTPKVVTTSDSISGTPEGIGGGASQLFAAGDPYGPYTIGTSDAGEVISPPATSEWTISQTLAATSNSLSSNGLNYAYNDQAVGQSTVPTLEVSSESGGLNLLNFVSGEFGISLNAGVGVSEGSYTETSTTYDVSAWSENTLESVASELPGLEARFPGFAPLADWLGTMIGSGQPESLGAVISSSTGTVSDGGDLIDPSELAAPTGPVLNINNYLVAGSNNSGGSGGANGSGSTSTVSTEEFEADQPSLDSQGTGFQVSDTAANISAVIDDLSNDSDVTAITLTDSGTPTLQLSASQVADDTSALAEIINATYAINVDDTAANVSQNFDALNANSNVTAITLSDGNTSSLTLSVAQALGDTKALGKITNADYGIVISDTAADVSADFNALKADASVSSITLIDSGTPTLDLSVSQALNGASILAEISNPTYAIQIEDTAANVLGESAALAADARVAGIKIVDTAANVIADATELAANSQVTSITVEDSAADIIANTATIAQNTQIKSIVVVDTAANVLTDAGSLEGDAIIVVDTAADVSANIDALNGDTDVGEIELTDGATPTLRLTVDQALRDTTALGEIENSNFALDISDTAANVAASLDALASDTQLGSITLTDAGTPTLTVTAAQIVNDTAVLADITNSDLTIDVSDTAANVAANINALDNDSRIASIVLTDSGTPTLVLSVAQALDDTAALAKISGSAYSISLSDTAADVSVAIDALNADAKISSITLTDSGTPTLVLSAAQFLGDTTALSEITNANYQIVVLDSAANVLANNVAFSSNSHFASAAIVDSVANVLAQETAIAANSQVNSVFVSDSAANVSANIDALNADSKIAMITMTDSGVPTLTLSVAQALGDGHAISSIANENYGIALSDTADNVAANIDALNSDGAITSITLTDSETPSLDLSAVQAAADSQVLSKITNSNYNIVISGSLADVLPELALLDSNPHVIINILDSATDVSANIDALQAATGLASISLTDSGVPTLSMTATQVADDTVLLGKIAGSFTIAVTDTASNVLANRAALSANPLVTAVAIVDTAAEILGNYQALQTDAQISSLTVQDNVADILASNTSLDNLAGLAGIEVVDTAENVLANAEALSGISQVSSVTVLDSAANIGASLVQLADDSQVSSIQFTDSGTPAVTLTASAVSSAWKLSESGLNYTITVVDSSANISADIDQFYGYPVTSITLTDTGVPLLTLSASQVLGDQSILSKITNENYGIAVVDSAADLSSDIDALNSVSDISSITLTDSGTESLNLTVAQVLDDTAALSKVTNAGYKIAISDTAANILANEAALQDDKSIASVNVIDGAASVLANASALAADSQIATVSVVDSVANVLANSSALSADSFVTSVQIEDNAADISENIDALNGLSKLSSIKLMDYGTLKLTVAQVLEDGNALSAIAEGSGFYQIAVSDTAANIANNLAALTSDNNVTSVNVVDTLANFTAYESTFANSTLEVNFDPQDVPTVTFTSTVEASNLASQTITGLVVSGGSATVVGQTVTLTDNGATLATAVVQSDGTFSTSVTLPDQGVNSIVAKVTDSDGNTGSSSAITDTLDSIAPTATITSAAESSDVAAQTVTGTVTSGGAAVVVGETVTLTDNGTALGTAVVQADGSFTANETLPNEGANSIVATVTDSYGNTGSSAAVVDTLEEINGYYFTRGQGQVTVDASVGTVVMPAGVTSSDVYLEADGAGDLTITVAGDSTDSVVVNGDLSLWEGSVISGLSQIDFSDGSALNLEQPLTFTWLGNASNYDLVGSNYGANLFDITNAGSITFGSGQNTINYSQGSGRLNVSLNGGTGKLQFGAGITASDISLQVDASGDLTISIVGDSADSIVIAGDLTQWEGSISSALSEIQFGDGSVLNLEQNPLTFTWLGDSTGFNLAGSNLGTNQFDVTHSGSITFGGGQNVIDYSQGSGELTVSLNGSSGTLKFGAGITADDIQLQVDSSGDLTIKIAGDSTDSIVINGDLTEWEGNLSSGLSEIQFSDGSTLNLEQNPLTFTWLGESSGYNIAGTNFGTNLFDITNSGSVTFGSGQNIINYSRGSGQLDVSLNGSTGTLQLGAGITRSDVNVQSDGSGDLTISFNGDATDSIVIRGDVTDWEGTVSSGLSQIQFSDGTVVNTLNSFAPTISITSAAESGNVEAQTISGSVASSGSATIAGEVVTLTDNGAILGTATVQTNDTFTTSVTLPNQGANSIVATVTDSLGFVGTSTAVVDTLDTIAPTVAITSSAETGNAAAQTITGLVVSGGAASVVGQTVTLTDNGTALATTTVQSDGTFSVGVTLPNQGANSIVAAVCDSYGNSASSAAVVDTLNNSAPTVTITSAAEGSNDPGQTIAGTVAPVGTASVVGQTVTLTDNGTTLATATVQADGSFAADVTLPNQGTNSIVAVVTDSDGNTGSSSAVADLLDDVAPTVTLTSAAETSDVAAQTIAGSVLSGGVAAVAGQTVTLTDNGTTLATASVQTNGTFTASVTLPDQGTNDIVATVSDSYGNTESSAALDDTLIANDLAVTISSETLADDTGASSTDYITNDGNVTLTGTTTAGSTVSISNGTTDIGTASVSGTSWSFSRDLAQGTYQLQATATDAYGDTVTTAPAHTIVVDDTAPQPVITADNPYVSGTNIDLSLSGTSEADSVIQAFDGTTLLGVTTTNAAGAWSLDVSPTWDGHNSLSVVATDLAGNIGTYTEPTADAEGLVYAPTSSGGFGGGVGAIAVPWQQNGITTAYLGVPSSDVYLQSNGWGDLTLRIVGDDVDSVEFADDLSDPSGYPVSGISQLYFSDGTIVNLEAPLTFTWYGTSNNYGLTGSDFGANIFNIEAGADNGSITLGNTSDGGNGKNTINYVEGAGGLSVNVNNGVATLDMGSGLTASDVYIQSGNWGNLYVDILGDANDNVLFESGLTDDSGVVNSALQYIQFSDGTSINLTGPLTFTWYGTSNNYSLNGSDYGANLYNIEVGAGNGSITLGNRSSGGDGANTINYVEGAGSLSVNVNNGVATLAMGSGLTASDVYIQSGNWGNLYVDILGDSGDSILFNSGLTDTDGVVSSALQDIQFNDGSSINLTGPLTFTWYGTSSNYSLNGSDYGANVYNVEAGAGNGSITLGNTSSGGDGANTINYVEGAGSLSVNVNNGAATLDMGSGLTASDVYIQSGNWGNLYVDILGDPSDSILFNSGLTDTNGVVSSALQDIQFSDGTSINLTGPLTFTWYGTSNNYSLNGSDYGANVYNIEAGAGGGSITLGNTSGGGDGANTINYVEGAGDLSVNLNNGIATLEMGSGLTASDVYIQSGNWGNLYVGIIGDSSDSIVFNSDLTDTNGVISSALQAIQFSDGTSINLAQGSSPTFTWFGTPNSSMTGSNYGANAFEFGAGSESATGGSGNNTYIASSNTGQATINANATTGSTNELDFTGAITSDNLWFEQSGNNLLVDVLGKNTQVDVNGWFSSSSNQLQEITAGGLKIDSQISQLVQAMATYSAANPGFDPTSSTVQTIPNDTNLQSSVAAAWHS